MRRCLTSKDWIKVLAFGWRYSYEALFLIRQNEKRSFARKPSCGAMHLTDKTRSLASNYSKNRRNIFDYNKSCLKQLRMTLPRIFIIWSKVRFWCYCVTSVIYYIVATLIGLNFPPTNKASPIATRPFTYLLKNNLMKCSSRQFSSIFLHNFPLFFAKITFGQPNNARRAHHTQTDQLKLRITYNLNINLGRRYCSKSPRICSSSANGSFNIWSSNSKH